MDELLLLGFVDEMDKIAMSTKNIKRKIAQPPTGDTGPEGKGLDDPRAEAAQFKKAASADSFVLRFLEELKSR